MSRQNKQKKNAVIAKQSTALRKGGSNHTIHLENKQRRKCRSKEGRIEVPTNVGGPILPNKLILSAN
jgi:hypothetical protein